MTDRCRFAGFLKTGSVERSDDSGSGRTPLICAASIAMAAAARSRPGGDVHALGDEPAGDRQPDTPAGAGDYRCLPVQLKIHDVSRRLGGVHAVGQVPDLSRLAGGRLPALGSFD